MRCISLSAALLVIAVSACPCSAQQQRNADAAPSPASQAGADVESLIARLADASWSQRESATRELEILCAVGSASAESLLARGRLNPEQQSRLLAIARDEFFARQPAALGINMDVQHGAAGVRIANTFGNFPSSAAITPGDVILRMGGVTLDSPDPDIKRNVLGNVIRSYFPGEVVPLVILRAGKQVDVSVEMGRFGDLDRLDQRRRGVPQELQFAAREACWAYRMGRLCATQSPASLNEPMQAQPMDAAPQTDEPGMAPQRRTIVAGEPRGDVTWSVGIGAQPSQDSIIELMRAVSNEISNEVAQRDLATTRIASIPMSDAERQRLSEAVEGTNATIRRLVDQRRELAAQLRELWR